MNDFINIVIVIISLLIIIKLIYEYLDPNTRNANTIKNKISKSEFYKLVTINLLPFFIYELYKDQKFYDDRHPLHCKLGEIIVILFCYILYVEIIYPFIIN